MSGLHVAAGVVAAGSLALAGVLAGVAWVRDRSTRSWTRTTGVVVHRGTGRTDRGGPALYPTFRWEDAAGTVHERTSSMRQSLGPAPGTRVPVRYDPARPHRAIIDTAAQSGRILWPVAGVVALIGLVCAAALLTLAR